MPKNLGKKIPDEAFETLCVSRANIIIPGTMKDPYEISSITGIRLPIAAPNTTKYKEEEMTGENIL